VQAQDFARNTTPGLIAEYLKILGQQ
jgi:hypothetical protein